LSIHQVTTLAIKKDEEKDYSSWFLSQKQRRIPAWKSWMKLSHPEAIQAKPSQFKRKSNIKIQHEERRKKKWLQDERSQQLNKK
jgi:hypothetical protein